MGHNSFYQAAILAKERRQTWSNIVATFRIVAYVQGNARGRFGRLVGHKFYYQWCATRGRCLPLLTVLEEATSEGATRVIVFRLTANHH